MPQVMVEAFAKDLIDKIMLEAFDVMDTNNGKLQTLVNGEESAIESQSAHTMLQIHDRSCANHNEPEITELIEKMVCGLRNLQIEDSTSVPSLSSNLEKQVKHVVCNIDSDSTVDWTKTVGVPITQDQDDMHQIMQNAVIERPTNLTCTRTEKENYDSNEITGASISLLHQMIEEPETKTKESSLEKENESDSLDEEERAAWEKMEEEFLKLDLTPYIKNITLKEVVVEEIAPSPLPAQTKSSLEIAFDENKKKSCAETKSQNQKKKNVLSRIRKMLRIVFKRQKN